MSRRAEAGADVSVNPMFSVLLKQLINTQRFFSNCISEICPLSQSLSARAIFITACCALAFPRNQIRPFATAWVTSWPGCSASWAAAGHAVLGTYRHHLYFHYGSTQAAWHLCKRSLDLRAKGLHILPMHPHSSWIRLSLPCYTQLCMAIPSISLQDFICHQSVSLDSQRSPASSLLRSLSSPRLSKESLLAMSRGLFLLQFAKLPLRLWAEDMMLVSCYKGDCRCRSSNFPVSLHSSSAPPPVPSKILKNSVF